MTRSWVLLVALLGCDGGADKGTSDPPTPDSGSPSSCGDNVPIIEDVLLQDNGEHEFGEGQGAEVWPSILLQVTASDADKDLDFYRMEVWYDTDIDGTVDTDRDPDYVREATVSDEECTVPVANVGMIIAVSGTPPYNADTEWGVIIEDSGGTASELWISGTFRTPEAL